MTGATDAPDTVLARAMADITGIAVAFIFGSMASASATPESDCDLMVVTRPGLSVTVYPAETLRRKAAEQGFVARVLDGKKRWVRGSEAELARLLAPR